MRTDPTDNGGLFIGRRPGTRPIKYRALPEYGHPWRQRFDRGLAGLILAATVLVCLLFWGPLPVAWMWVGSQVDYLTGSTFLGIVVAFLGLLATLLVGLMVMRRLDLLWILVRRAGGHDQREGIIGRVFAVSTVRGRRSSSAGCCCSAACRPASRRRGERRRPAGGLSDRDGPARLLPAVRGHDRRRGQRAAARALRERRRRALAKIEPLDLSATTWHEFPHPDVVAAITYAARRGINRFSDPQAIELRRELGRRHGLEPERIAVGNGASELLWPRPQR